MTTHFYLTAATISSALLMGGLVTLFAGLSRAAKDHLALTAKRGIWLSVCFTLAMIAMTFAGGLLVNAWGLANVLILGALLGGFSIALLGLSNNYQMALTAATAMGAGAGILHTAAAVAMPVAFFSMANAPAATNFGYIFVVLGCLIFPFACSFLIDKIGFRNGLLALALTSLIPALFATLAGDGPNGFPPPVRSVDLPLLMSDLRLWLAVIGVFCYYAVEIAAVQWGGKYLSELGFRERGQSLLLVAFWTIFLGSRLLCSTFEGDNIFAWLLLILVIIAAASLGHMVGFHNRTSGGFAFLVLAAVVGPVFPIMVGLVFKAFAQAPYHQPAVAFGVIFAIGTIGRLIAEPVMQRLVERDRARLAIGATMVLMLVVAIPALVLLMLQWE